MDEKKIDILERSTGVFLRLGIKSVTMDDLARELGISKKTIYKYFADKNELVSTIIRFKVNEDCNAVAGCKTSTNAIEEMFVVSEFIMEQLKNVTPTVFFDLKKYHPEAWQIMEDHKWNFVRNLIKQNIERGIKEEIYRKNADPLILSGLYVSATDTILNSQIFPWPHYKFQDVYMQMILNHLFGISNTKGREYLKQRLKNEHND